jgi:hypothetical protein
MQVHKNGSSRKLQYGVHLLILLMVCPIFQKKKKTTVLAATPFQHTAKVVLLTLAYFTNTAPFPVHMQFASP